MKHITSAIITHYATENLRVVTVFRGNKQTNYRVTLPTIARFCRVLDAHGAVFHGIETYSYKIKSEWVTL